MTITEFCARLDVEVSCTRALPSRARAILSSVARSPQGCDVFRKELANPDGGDTVFSSTDFNITLAVPVQEDPKPESDDDLIVVEPEAAATSVAKGAPCTAPKPKEMRLLEFFCEYQPQQANLAQVRQLLEQHKGRLHELADILEQHHGVAPDLSDESVGAGSDKPAVAAAGDVETDQAPLRTEFVCLECSVHPSELEQWVSILTCAMSQQDAKGSQVDSCLAMAQACDTP